MRVILLTGKGGVGKTTVAAATALRSAGLGYRTVVLSPDAAPSLGASFDIPLGPEPKAIGDKLWAQETDVEYNLRKHWGIVEQWLRSLLQWRGLDELVADEIAILPGMDELSALLWVNQHCGSGDFDVVIVDCAPTGETLKLLSFPDVAGGWVEKMLPIHRRVVGVLRPVIRPFTDLPLPGVDELSALRWITQHCDSGDYDVIIVDCAPTGETLKLLSFPDVAGWWVEKMLPIHRRVVSVLRPVIRPFTDLPLPGDDVYAAGEDLFRRLEELHALLADPAISYVRLLVNAEKMVIKEAQCTVT